MNTTKILTSDEDLEALVRFSRLSLAAQTDLIVFLKNHEDELALCINDFGELEYLFEQLFSRAPKCSKRK